MMDVGRLCVKIAGRDSGKRCVIVDVIDRNYVMVDGETRRKKSNIKHLEPMDTVLDIKKGASHEEIASELGKLGIKLPEPKKEEKKEEPAKEKKPAKAKKAKE